MTRDFPQKRGGRRLRADFETRVEEAQEDFLRQVVDEVRRTSLETEEAAHRALMALYEFLRLDANGFLRTVRAWPPSVYSAAAIVKPLVERLLVRPDCEPLQRALAALFSQQGKHDKAVAILLRLGHADDVFAIVEKHGEHRAVAAKARELLQLDHARAVDIPLSGIATHASRHAWRVG